jgi:uncharacterized protein (TIGR03435 family)
MTADAVLAHVWQSTLVAGAIALVALAFRRAPAWTRYWIWFAASLKFVVPFAALTLLGAQLEWREALPSAPPSWTLAIESVSQPLFVPYGVVPLQRATADAGIDITAIALVIWLLGGAMVLGMWLLRWRRVAQAVHAGAPVASGRVFEALTRLDPSAALPVVSADTSLEPGVFGVVRPVLLWPRDIDARLDDAQVRAILAHELAHVRRRDNLTAAVHMLVEAAFWFHPLVWLIGGRLADERERACDEEVVRLGSDPHVYAESLLRTCQFCLESPPITPRASGALSCMSGVTGSDLKKRIVRIVTQSPRTNLGMWRKTLLVTAAAGIIAVPVAIGALTAPRAPTLSTPDAGTASFEVASVKPNKTGDRRVSIGLQPGGRFNASNVPLRMLLRQAYDIQEFQIVGGPGWLRSDRFDVVAKTPEGEYSANEMRPMLRALLAERFKLRAHHETREMPVYSLMKARRDGSLGPNITPADVDCVAVMQSRRGGPPPAPPQPGQKIDCGFLIGVGRMNVGGMPMISLARSLSSLVGRTVVDKTGLTGGYDFELTYAPEGLGGLPVPPNGVPPHEGAPNAPTIFTALQEQLGLKLDPRRATVDVLVIDSIEKPAEN